MKTDELINLLDQGLLVVTQNLDIVLRNQAAWHEFGFPDNANNLSAAVGPDQLSHWQTIVLRADKDRTFRTTVDGPDGNAVHVYACSSANHQTLLSLSRPGPLLEEQPLLDSYARALADHGIGLWRIDMSTSELWWSPKCYELLGMPEGPISTAAYLEKLSEEDQATIGDHIHRVGAGMGDKAYAPNFQVTDADGTRHLNDRTRLLTEKQANGGPVFVGATLDRTREVELEARCAELQSRLNDTEAVRATSQLAGAVAHDLNNVMTALLGNAELLGMKSQDPDLAEHLDAISVASNHASALAGRMLDFVRKRPLSRKPLNLAELITQNFNFLRTLVPESIQINLRIDTNNAVISGDRHRLEQALYNLILNAGQAVAGEGTTVMVGLEDRDDQVLLTIRDDGKGMSREERQRVFEPFYTTRVGGAGLGLSSVRQVVDNHGGSISIASEYGVGSQFVISLPRGERDEDDAQPNAADFKQRSLHIWIAEDDNMVRLVLERLLLGAKHQVRAFAKPSSLLKVLDTEAHSPDLIITDMIMPEMSGAELFEQIRAREPGLRVLFMSGYTDKVLGTFHRQIEAGNLLHKPFKRLELFNAVEDIMRRSPADYDAGADANEDNPEPPVTRL
ncbi:MAG: ATP-binding protein [Lysobacterales bacterium]